MPSQQQLGRSGATRGAAFALLLVGLGGVVACSDSPQEAACKRIYEDCGDGLAYKGNKLNQDGCKSYLEDKLGAAVVDEVAACLKDLDCTNWINCFSPRALSCWGDGGTDCLKSMKPDVRWGNPGQYDSAPAKDASLDGPG